MYGNNYPNDYEGSGQNNQGNQNVMNNHNGSAGGPANQNYDINHTGVYSGYQSYIPPDPPKKEKKPRKKGGLLGKLAVAASLGLCFGLFAGAGFYAVELAAGKDGQDTQQAVSDSVDRTSDSGKELADSEVISTANNMTAVTSDVTDVVNKVMPSMVSITNVFTETSNFFGQTMENQNQASGSGIIVGENDTELLVVTNYHVIEGADTLTVHFIDDEEAEAQVKGYDSEKDLAVIAIPLENIKSTTKDNIAVATLGDSDSLKVGEPAIAIGNALGYGQSVSTGVISAVDRELTVGNVTNRLIQTDAAINPGNSGGALLNINGEVIGINSNKIGGSVVEGMGYAIPISAAKPIIEELMTKVTRAKVAEGEASFLGISGVNVTEDVAKMYGMPKGVYVAQVYEGTPAEKAGLVKGDIITKFDGTTVTSMEELQGMMQYYAAGTEVEMTIKQGSPSGYQEKKVVVHLGAKSDEPAQ